MMDIIAAVRIVRLCVGLLLIWAIFYISYRRFLLDSLRQKLFQIRDNLFDFAADGGIEFSDFCYRDLRDDINSLLLFAHKLSLTRMLFAQWTLDPSIARDIERWNGELERLAPLARKTLREARQRALGETMLYIIRRSVVLYLLFIVLAAVSLWIATARDFYQKLPDLAKPIEAQARNEYRLAA